MEMLYAGLTGSHVFATKYLSEKPGVTSYDLRCLLNLLDSHERKRYHYDYLDRIYNEYMHDKGAYK